jgi:hypothetical protein
MQYSIVKPAMRMYIRVKIIQMHNVTAATRKVRGEVNRYI